MKRIDHIMKITLDNSTEPKDVLPPERKTTPKLKRTQLQVAQEISSDVGFRSPLIVSPVELSKDYADSPAALLPPADQRKDYAVSPVAPLYSPLTPAHQRKHYVDSPAAPLPPAHQKKDYADSPAGPLPPEGEIKGYADSPVAPLYSPLTPADQRKHADSPAAPLPPADQRKDYDDSPAAPLYSPLTPAVKKCSILQNPNIEDSPLPAMSPSTLEMYNTLTESVNLEDFTIIDSPLSVENNKREVAINPRKRGRTIEDTPSSPEDFSPDTSTDYVPDSDETDEPETDEHGKNSRRRRVAVTAMVHNNPYDGPSGSKEVQVDTSATTPRIDDPIMNLNSDDQQQKGRCKKGRKRKNADYTLAERKDRKYANLPYKTKTKTIEPKVFKDKECKCKQKCSQLIPSEKRKEEFEQYISLGSYEAQLLFILNNVKEVPKKRSYTSVQNNNKKAKPKTYHRIYTIRDQKVCKDMFLSTFQITNQKVSTCLEKNRAKSYKDRRGVLQGGWNRTSQEDIEFIKGVINALPKYESHYTREKNSQVMYLQTGMTVGKIYELYTEKVQEVYGPDKKCVSLGTLKTIFYKHFNLRCKVLKADTCNRCDVFANKIHDARSAQEKEEISKERDEHQKRAEDLRKSMNEDLKQAKTDDKFECLTFDLEKTLPLPRLATSVIFYKRQLWLYNSGIHAGSNDSGHCYVWVEGEAGRGAQEVGSCLIKYIKTKLCEKVEHLVLWSDCCGGQNRNIKVILMLKALLNSHAHLKTITFKYLESGHTWLPNDTDFSKIETQLKFHERIYTANDYINVIKCCKRVKPLTVYKMQKEDFLGVNKIEKNVTNRKTFVTKEKVNWLKTKEILLTKEKRHTLFMRNGLDDNFKELSVEKKARGQVLDISETDFITLWPDGKEIAQAKLDDLKSLYNLIPRDCLPFYESLKGNNNVIDDIDGFGGVPDFDQDGEFYE